MKKKRTGRIYLKSNFLPSITFLEPMDDDGNKWFFTYSSAGRYYGQKEGNLEDLLISVLKDCIIKYLPAGLNKKNCQEIINSPGWLEKNLDSKIDRVISNLRGDFFNESGNLSDISNIMTPLMKKMVEKKILSSYKISRENSIVIGLDRYKISEIIDILGKYNPHQTKIELFALKLLPSKNMGIKKTRGNYSLNVHIGVKKIEDSYDYVDKIIMEIIDKTTTNSSIKTEFLNDFLKYLISNDDWSFDKPNSIIKVLSKYCGQNIEIISQIKNEKTLHQIIKLNKMEKFGDIIKLYSQELL